MDNRKLTGLVIATAAAVAFVAAPISGALAAKQGSIQCLGVNSCKGKGGCKTDKNACKGKNSCKGQGAVKMSKKKCEKKGGQVMSENDQMQDQGQGQTQN